MIDPNTVLDWSSLLGWWDPEALLGGLASVTTATAFYYGLDRMVRGRRWGTLTTEGVVARRGWLRTRLEALWPPQVVDVGFKVLGLGLVALGTFFGLSALNLPGGALTHGLLALVAMVAQGWYTAHTRGRCLAYEKGLWVEGRFYQWDQVELSLRDGEAVFEVGKDELVLPAGEVERRQLWLDPPLLVRWRCLRAQARLG